MSDAAPSAPASSGDSHVPERVIALLDGRAPKLDDTVWLAPGSYVVGDVRVGADCSVWYNAVLRGDSDAVRVGTRSNFQDGAIVHTQAGEPAVIGDDVSVGHNAVVHGARIGDGCLIGMNATVLSGATVGAASLVAAGALVPQGMQVPEGSLVAGVPARIVRSLRDDEIEGLLRNASNYLGYTADHRDAIPNGPVEDLR